MACVVPVYRPRDAEHTVLHQVIAEHLEGFLRAAAEAGEGEGLPRFVAILPDCVGEAKHEPADRKGPRNGRRVRASR